MQALTVALLWLLLLSTAAAQPPSWRSPATATNGVVPATLEELAKTIAEGEGRAVYDAFRTMAIVAKTPEQQTNAFTLVFPYLTSDKMCLVENFRPPPSHVTSASFTYSDMAADAIWGLGPPARSGLAKALTPPESALAERCALILCGWQEAALYAKGKTRERDFPELEPDVRNALKEFFQHQASSFSVTTLERFYRAGFTNAAGYILAIMRTTKDHYAKLGAVSFLGRNGYEPALNDLLGIFRTDATLRSTVREELRYFADSDRVTKAVTEIMNQTEDEVLLRECRNALELVHIQEEIIRLERKPVTNNPSGALLGPPATQ